MGRIARATGIQFGIIMAQTVFGFVATILIIRRLGFAAWGHFAIGMALTMWLTIPLTGVRGAMLKRMSEGADRGRYLGAGVIITAAFLAVIGTALLIARGHVNAYVGIPVAAALFAMVTAKTAANLGLATLRGEDRLELNSLLDGVMGLGTKAAQLALVLAGVGAVGLYHGITLASVLTLFIAAYLIGTRIRRPRKEDFHSLWSYGRYSWLTNIKNTSYSWMDTVILAFFVSSSAVGAYETAWRVSMLFIFATRAFGMMVFPEVSKLDANGDREELETLVSRGLTFSGVFAFPGIIGAVILGRDVLKIYGAGPEEIAIAVPALAILGFGRLFESYENILIEVLNALDRPRLSFRITVVFMVANIGLNAVLIWTIGTLGAALATTTSVLISGILAYRAIPDHLAIRIHRRPVLAQIASAGVMGAVLAAITTVRPSESIPVTVLYVFLGASVYALTLYAVSPSVRAFTRDNVPDDALAMVPGVQPDRGGQGGQ